MNVFHYFFLNRSFKYSFPLSVPQSRDFPSFWEQRCAGADPGFPRRGRQPQRRRQPIPVFGQFFPKTAWNEKFLNGEDAICAGGSDGCGSSRGSHVTLFTSLLLGGYKKCSLVTKEMISVAKWTCSYVCDVSDAVTMEIRILSKMLEENNPAVCDVKVIWHSENLYLGFKQFNSLLVVG